MRAKRTYEEIEAIALQYTTLKDFIKNDKSAYTIASSNNWMPKFTWLKRINKKWAKRYGYKTVFKSIKLEEAYVEPNENGFDILGRNFISKP